MEITKVVKPFIIRRWPNTFGNIVYIHTNQKEKKRKLQVENCNNLGSLHHFYNPQFGVWDRHHYPSGTISSSTWFSIFWVSDKWTKPRVHAVLSPLCQAFSPQLNAGVITPHHTIRACRNNRPYTSGLISSNLSNSRANSSLAWASRETEWAQRLLRRSDKTSH